MNIGDTFRMLFERGNAMQSFWGFYITVSLGLIAFFGNAHRSRILATVMSLAFIAFAIVNCRGMTNIASQRTEIFNFLESSDRVEDTSSPSLPKEVAEKLVKVSKPPAPKDVATFHVVADVGVLAAMWILTLRPKNE